MHLQYLYTPNAILIGFEIFFHIPFSSYILLLHAVVISWIDIGEVYKLGYLLLVVLSYIRNTASNSLLWSNATLIVCDFGSGCWSYVWSWAGDLQCRHWYPGGRSTGQVKGKVGCLIMLPTVHWNKWSL